MSTRSLLNATQDSMQVPAVRSLVVGVGSPHGQDTAGWAVVSQLQSLMLESSEHSQIELRKVTVPHQILDWLSLDRSVHIVDACLAGPATVCRFELHSRDKQLHSSSNASLNADTGQPSEQSDVALLMKNLNSSSSHQLDLPTVLQLAATLCRLPRAIVLWTVPIDATHKSDQLDATLRVHVDRCARQIIQELADA